MNSEENGYEAEVKEIKIKIKNEFNITICVINLSGIIFSFSSLVFHSLLVNPADVIFSIKKLHFIWNSCNFIVNKYQKIDYLINKYNIHLIDEDQIKFLGDFFLNEASFPLFKYLTLGQLKELDKLQFLMLTMNCEYLTNKQYSFIKHHKYFPREHCRNKEEVQLSILNAHKRILRFPKIEGVFQNPSYFYKNYSSILS